MTRCSSRRPAASSFRKYTSHSIPRLKPNPIAAASASTFLNATRVWIGYGSPLNVLSAGYHIVSGRHGSRIPRARSGTEAISSSFGDCPSPSKAYPVYSSDPPAKSSKCATGTILPFGTP